MKLDYRPAEVFFGVAIGLAVILGWGCSSTRTNGVEWDLNAAWNPYYLYSSAEPYRELYVEVDAVEGMEPREEALDALKSFLQTYCDKPGGITIVRSDRIARDKARGFFHSQLGMWYIDGPGTNWSGRQPAFLYVLYYDSTLEPPRLQNPHEMMPRSAAVFALPGSFLALSGHATYLPYPSAIFINGHWRGRETDEAIIQHEAAHSLGLHHGPKLHCDSSDCLMYPNILVNGWTFWKGFKVLNKTFCATCRNQLLAKRKERAAEPLRFEGPWLARRENGYEVWTLPSLTLVQAPVLREARTRGFCWDIKRIGFSYLATNGLVSPERPGDHQCLQYEPWRRIRAAKGGERLV